MAKVNNELDNFLKAIKNDVIYWATIDKKAFEGAMKHQGITEAQYRLDGLAFSILCIIDGCSSLNDFHGYEMRYGNKVFNNCELHEAFTNYRQEPLEER